MYTYKINNYVLEYFFFFLSKIFHFITNIDIFSVTRCEYVNKYGQPLQTGRIELLFELVPY